MNYKKIEDSIKESLDNLQFLRITNKSKAASITEALIPILEEMLGDNNDVSNSERKSKSVY